MLHDQNFPAPSGKQSLAKFSRIKWQSFIMFIMIVTLEPNKKDRHFSSLTHERIMKKPEKESREEFCGLDKVRINISIWATAHLPLP